MTLQADLLAGTTAVRELGVSVGHDRVRADVHGDPALGEGRHGAIRGSRHAQPHPRTAHAVWLDQLRPSRLDRRPHRGEVVPVQVGCTTLEIAERRDG